MDTGRKSKGGRVIALVVVSTFAVLVLGILVAGLLRSHADILRSLHELGVGVGDPAVDATLSTAGTSSVAPTAVAPPTTLPPTVGQSPPLGPAPTIAGQTPAGDARAISVTNSDGLTLLAFLSSGCATCVGFWDALQRPGHLDLPGGTRAVIVTKGSDREVPSEVRARTTGQIPVVMSTDAWVDYQVPGSPFFVLVDGATGVKVGQGVASHLGQLAELVRRAEHDRGGDGTTGDRGRGRRAQPGIGGPAREAAADDVLRAAGIHPGDPSLYPHTLEDVFPHGAPPPPTAAPSEGPARG
jgi:hypothetical protein